MRKRTLASATLSALLVTMCGQSAFAAWGATPPNTGYWDPYAHPNGGKYALVCTETNFGGSCYTLSRDIPNDPNPWTCYDGEWGWPRNKIKSAIIGKDVHLSLFWYILNTSDNSPPKVLTPGYYSTLGSWNGQSAAARLVDRARAEKNCLDVRDGELALFTDSNYSGDCVTLSGAVGLSQYNRAYSMCFRNDTASSAKNRTGGTVKLHRNIDFGGSAETLSNNQDKKLLQYNDSMSSVSFP